MLRRLNLNLLYSLDAILNTRTLIDAGQRIHLSQPAMSLALRKLREHFRDDLIVQAGGDRAMTPLAQALRPRGAQLLRDADEAFGLTLGFNPGTAVATVRIAAPEAVEVTLLSRAVPILLAQAPSIDIQLMPFDYSSVERLFDLEADLAVLPQDLASARLITKPLFDEQPACLIWEEHPTIGATISPEQFLTARHVAVDDTIMPYGRIGGAGADMMARRTVVVRTGLYAMLPGLVIGTDLVAMASDWMSQYFASLMPVRVIRPPFTAMPQTIVAQWQPHRRVDPMIAWLCEGLARALPRG